MVVSQSVARITAVIQIHTLCVCVLTGYGDEAREHGTRARTRERHEGATHKYFSQHYCRRACVCVKKGNEVLERYAALRCLWHEIYVVESTHR